VGPIEKRDPWLGLSPYTAARIALGRAGGSLRTETLLDFRLAHARAKDAVAMPFDAGALAREIELGGIATWALETEATDRRSFLLRPDLGRKLRASSRAALGDRAREWGARDMCVIVSDGLSALAAQRQTPSLLAALIPLLGALGVSLYPVFIAPFCRVKLSDEVGQALSARHALILLGERPGLSSPDSLGAYLTLHPHATRTDADRHCVSNIRPDGLAHAEAARTLAEIVAESASAAGG